MIRNGQHYRDSIRDGRQVWINGERVPDVALHPMFKPLVDIRAHIYDMAHEAGHASVMTYCAPESGETCAIGTKLPLTQQDWHAKREAVNAVLDEIGGQRLRLLRQLENASFDDRLRLSGPAPPTPRRWCPGWARERERR